jgi:regulatory protein
MPGIITKITRNRHDQNRKNVSIDGSFAFSVNLFESLSLKKDDCLNDDEIKHYQENSYEYQAYEDSIRILKARIKSTHELKFRLKGKEYPENIIEKAVQRLQEENYLNDMEFARIWTDNRVRFSPRSRYALSFELKQKGISEEIIDKILKKTDDSILAWNAIRKKIYHWKDLEDETFRHKVLNLLKNRGFNYDVSLDAFEKACLKRNQTRDNEEVL